MNKVEWLANGKNYNRLFAKYQDAYDFAYNKAFYYEVLLNGKRFSRAF